MKLWSQERYIAGWNYASAVHAGQKIPGANTPYINHIGLVAMEVMAAIADSGEVEFPDLLVLCALLHDTIEDTNCSFDDIESRFGVSVADGVMALSKNEALPSKDAQMADSLRRIKDQPKEVWMVKLADRITNLQPPPNYWDAAKIKNYRSEAIIILDNLGVANDFLAGRLGRKISDYQQYE